MTLLEDYWFPRREGGRGTEVQTLPPGQNLGEMGDILYFQENLYKALNVPSSRLKQDTAFALGRSTEISRDEVKFARFIGRLRLKFTSLFLKCLERQLILKGIINSDDWDNISSRISFDFNKDNYFAELKESEIFTERLNLLALADPYTDKYFSHNWIRRVVLRQSDDEIERQDEIIKQEMDDPQYNPPPEQDTEQNSEPAQQPGQTNQ
jgi:hypothetical protein